MHQGPVLASLQALRAPAPGSRSGEGSGSVSPYLSETRSAFGAVLHQRLLTSQGAIWVVQKIAGDMSIPGACVIHLVREREAGEVLAETADVLAGAWPAWCHAHSVLAADRMDGIEPLLADAQTVQQLRNLVNARRAARQRFPL